MTNMPGLETQESNALALAQSLSLQASVGPCIVECTSLLRPDHCAITLAATLANDTGRAGGRYDAIRNSLERIRPEFFPECPPSLRRRAPYSSGMVPFRSSSSHGWLESTRPRSFRHTSMGTAIGRLISRVFRLRKNMLAYHARTNRPPWWAFRAPRRSKLGAIPGWVYLL